MNRRELGQRFARLATNAVVRNPRLWRFFRPLVRKQFDAIAGSWDTMRDPTHLAPYEAALAAGCNERTARDQKTGNQHADGRRGDELDVGAAGGHVRVPSLS